MTRDLSSLALHHLLQGEVERVDIAPQVTGIAQNVEHPQRGGSEEPSSISNAGMSMDPRPIKAKLSQRSLGLGTSGELSKVTRCRSK